MIVSLNYYVKSRLYSKNKVNDILNTLEIQTLVAVVSLFLCSTAVKLSSKQCNMHIL